MKADITTPLTAAEKAILREYQREARREWWSRQSPEERKARRQRYALNQAMKKRKEHETE